MSIAARLLAVAVLAAVASPAYADDFGEHLHHLRWRCEHGDRDACAAFRYEEWRAHEWRARAWHDDGPQVWYRPAWR